MFSFSKTVSETFSLSPSFTIGFSSSAQQTTQGAVLQEQFTQTVSSSFSQRITRQISTATNITASGPVPPHSFISGDYGVDGVLITYDLVYWQLDDHRCWWHGTYTNLVADAPTTSERWIISGPRPI